MSVQFGSPAGILTTTWANKPASYPTGLPVFISNAGTTGSLWIYTGTRWKPLNGQALLASLDAVSSNIGSSATIVHQYLIPAGMLQTGDRIRARISGSKSGTTDAMTLRFYMGTAGTTSDTQVMSGTVLAAGNRNFGTDIDFRLSSATTLQQLSGITAPFGYSTSGSTAYPAAVSITSAAANALYFSVGIFSGGATNTVAIEDSQIFITSSGS